MAAETDLGVDVSLEQDFLLAFKWFMFMCEKITRAKGFHDDPPTDAECVALVHSEASELLEYLRAERGCAGSVNNMVRDDKIPSFAGVEAEGADIVIRLASWFQRNRWDLAGALMAKMRYNATRPYKHGGKAF